MALDIPLFLGPKVRSQINLGIKNVETLFYFMHALKKNILLHVHI